MNYVGFRPFSAIYRLGGAKKFAPDASFSDNFRVFTQPGSRAAVAGRLMLQPVYPQLRKYPCATAVTLGARSEPLLPTTL
jgi:hypothetical protein